MPPATQAAPLPTRRLTRGDAPAYRALMLQAYTESADAFTSTAEERASAPLAWWERRIASADGLSESFGAFAGTTLVGTVALEYSAKPKTRHSALVIGMYVHPAQRQQGAARALLAQALAAARARPGLLVLRLTLTEGNTTAQALYAGMGFAAWGTEPLAISTPNGFRGKVHMVLTLPAEPCAGPEGASTW